jgi:hypothetical protein
MAYLMETLRKEEKNSTLAGRDQSRVGGKKERLCVGNPKTAAGIITLYHNAPLRLPFGICHRGHRAAQEKKSRRVSRRFYDHFIAQINEQG